MHTVSDVMTTDLVTLREQDDLALAEWALALRRFRHLPVTRGEELVGLVTHRDVLRARLQAERSGRPRLPVRQFMTAEVVSIPPGTPLHEAAELMAQRKLGCLPVVEAGRLRGLVTEGDLVRFAGYLAAELADDAAALDRLERIPRQGTPGTR